MKWVFFLVVSFQAHSVTLISKSKYDYMEEVVKTSSCVLLSPHYQHEVSQIKKFDYSDKTGEEVIQIMLGDQEVFYTTYKSRPWSKVVAYRNRGSNWVYFNRRNNPRSMKSMVNTAIHEASHIVGFGHGGNNSQGKQNSVPYKIGKIAEKYAEDCK